MAGLVLAGLVLAGLVLADAKTANIEKSIIIILSGCECAIINKKIIFEMCNNRVRNK